MQLSALEAYQEWTNLLTYSIILNIVRGEPEVSSTEITASEQLQPAPSTAVVSGKRQRDEPQVTDRYDAHTDSDL